MNMSGKSGALEMLEGWWFSLFEVLLLLCFVGVFLLVFFLLEGYFAQLNDSV